MIGFPLVLGVEFCRITGVLFEYESLMQSIIICARAEELIPEKKSPEAMCWDIKADETFTLQLGELKLVKS